MEEGQEIYVGRGTFDKTDLDPVKVRQAETAWRSLIDNCRGMAFDIVEAAESPSTAWKMFTDKCQPNTVGEVWTLRRALMEMRMEQGENPLAFILHEERARSELAELNIEIDDDDIKVQIVTGLSNEYDNERRLPDSKSKEKLMMAKIRNITAQRFERLQQQK